MPGGGGLRLKYSNPIHLDDVAADFPEMTIIIAHPSWPLVETHRERFVLPVGVRVVQPREIERSQGKANRAIEQAYYYSTRK
jgi:predicted TIM-barrel fold metal-dependent hydrolase